MTADTPQDKERLAEIRQRTVEMPVSRPDGKEGIWEFLLRQIDARDGRIAAREASLNTAAGEIEGLHERLAQAEAECDAISDNVRRKAGMYATGSDGFNTLIMLAEWIEARMASRRPAAPAAPERTQPEYCIHGYAFDACGCGVAAEERTHG